MLLTRFLMLLDMVLQLPHSLSLTGARHCTRQLAERGKRGKEGDPNGGAISLGVEKVGSLVVRVAGVVRHPGRVSACCPLRWPSLLD